MSFGFSVGDFAALGHFAWKIYRACKDAPEGFKNIIQEVLSLHAVLRELEETHSDANLSAAQQSRLKIVGDGCRAVLQDLQDLVDRYNSLGTKTKRTWDRLAWGSENITELRSRLISNTILLTTFINTSQVIVQRKLDVFLQEFRDGKHEASIVSSQTVDSLSTDERQAWRAIRKELEDIGISLAAFDANKDFIMNWFKRVISTGAFEEVAAEEDGSSSILCEEDLSQSLEDPEHDTVSSQTLEDLGHDAKPTSASVGLQSPKAKTQRRRPPRVAAPINWLFRYAPDYNVDLVRAVDSGDETKARKALEKGADVNTETAGSTPLFLASFTGNEPMVQLLLDNGADVNWENSMRRTPLFYAVPEENESVLRLLLKNGVDINARDFRRTTMLHCSENDAIISILMENGADIEVEDRTGRSALSLAVSKGVETRVQLLLQNGAKINKGTHLKISVLHLAVAKGDEKMVHLLLENGANVNVKTELGDTVLHIASKFGHETLVQLFLRHKVEIDTKNKDSNTALHEAGISGHGKVVQLLLSNGANVNEAWPGHMVLHKAVESGRETVVELLLNHGANINEKDGYECTVLHQAAANGQKTMIELLLNHGANINEKNRWGSTALDWAINCREPKVVNLLRDAGGLRGFA
ncbi:hypothetical protein MMC22_012107 [Lobaria immixta]|nr:hypothetical protein [Lobaria immixta]